MFKLIHQLPRKIILACSGGIDSIAAFHWLNRSEKLNRVVHINHGTGKFADEAEEMVSNLCGDQRIPCSTYRINGQPPQGESKENWWRVQRYQAFEAESHCYGDAAIVLAHNLDDCVEEYVINSIVRGRHGTIPYQHGPVVRPFRTWSRDSITDYAIRNKLVWKEDPSNTDTKFLRNRIRHETMPHLYELNPGLHTMVRRMIESEV